MVLRNKSPVARALVASSLALISALPLAAPFVTGAAHAQATVITGHQVTSATVETVDTDTGTVLLRDDRKDGLITISVPRGATNLPRLQSGDRITLRFFQTIDADIARPGSPVPTSTVSSAKGYVHRHPHGTLVSFRRQRVHILALDVPEHKVTFIDPDDITRTVVLHEKAMQDLLATLKVGDDVDVTTMDAVTFSVTNRSIVPDVSVTEHSGHQDATPKAP